MPKLQQIREGETVYVQGSAKEPYKIRMIGGVVDCSCPAWRNMGGSNQDRVCKHIKANIDPSCLSAAARARAGLGGAPSLPAAPVAKAPAPTFLSSAGGSGKTAMAWSKTPAPAKTESKKPDLLLAQTWTPDTDPTGYWMSEKLDGVRALWDGTKFISRDGNEFVAPRRFRESIPANVVLDGELWLDRGKFQTTVSIVRKMVPSESEWESIRFVVFDAPRAFGTFEDRQTYLKKLYAGRPSPYWRVLEQERCHGRDHLSFFLEYVESMKGEGVMLREYGSLYEGGRNWTLLKVKTFHDAEATVIGYDAGMGKHSGRVGALVCAMDGDKTRTFNVGTGLTDRERENPPKIGTRITYKYVGLTDAGLPRHPSFVAIRDYE